MDGNLFDAFNDDSSINANIYNINQPLKRKNYVIEDEKVNKSMRLETSNGSSDISRVGVLQTVLNSSDYLSIEKVNTITGQSKPQKEKSSQFMQLNIHLSVETRDLSTVTTAEPAKIYAFKLDTFQQEAISYIEKGESVLVAAHTSAGKTAVAEYAIAKSLRDKQRVIYTSPIKALSNQKFRDMQEEFKDVGLMTGDMTINPNATCLIMTTEILRSMLYRGSEVMREVAWVIYDEVHYMRDKERGVVWEESIILLPHKVRFVFLSATIPNAKEFVGWVAKLHHQPCHVVYTEYRPVPLQHYVFPSGAEGLFLVVDHLGNFKEDTFQKAMSSLSASAEATAILNSSSGKNVKRKSGGGGGGKDKGAGGELFRIVKLVMDRGLDPCIVFSFSKKECETYALKMAVLDFTTDDEKVLINEVYENALEALSEIDRHLPQVETLLPLLKRGVGIHHGGLLPILKEITEILFQEGLIKCLFATETFSIGINMPAKTVVFTQTRKFDGKDFRWLTSGEYIQMSGRAGRRGKDKSGIVIQMLDEKMEPDVAKNMLYGPADPLRSAYHVGYNMVLNMLRVEDADPENLLRCSFHQYQQEQQSPLLEIQAEELQREAMAIEISNEIDIGDYYYWISQQKKIKSQMLDFIRKPMYCLPFLQPGRLVRIFARHSGIDITSSTSSNTSLEGVDWGYGVLVNCRKSTSTSSSLVDRTGVKNNNSNDEFVLVGNGGGIGADAEYILDVLVSCELNSPNDTGNEKKAELMDAEALFPMPPNQLQEGRPLILSISLSALSSLSAVKVNVPKDLKGIQQKKSLLKCVAEIVRRFKGDVEDIQPLDPVTDFGITDPAFAELSSRAEDLRTRVASSTFHKLPEKEQSLAVYRRKVELLESSKLLRSQSREMQTVAMKDDLRRMKRVLRRLGYITDSGVLETKGRFACELSTGDELVLTDMIFDGVFNELSPQEAVALLTCFVHKEPSKDPSKVIPQLQGPVRLLQNAARLVAKVSVDAKLMKEDEQEEYLNSFNTGLVEVAFSWASGATFGEICRITDVFEGSIIRSLRRLEELLRQLSSACTAIGNEELKVKFEEGARMIRRGVVFAASLYL